MIHNDQSIKKAQALSMSDLNSKIYQSGEFTFLTNFNVFNGKVFSAMNTK